ncbi:hypothetical protein [Pseudanabaena sp. FACHB-2040]|uniref:hypothetical protein n=1 Tax=Pseudanabaena sp. FACHB-2040 TaxID=2692859 RepID=UPI00168987D7|nr:hypothetical protein [Pseudanabaena sp. FACHB-2040]MBD2259931.1 hypothetical protein [Pseudanabaena sp. FACHB-2040]
MAKQISQPKSWRHPIKNAAAHRGILRAFSVKLALVLGLSSLTWVGQELLTPPAAVAYTSRVSLFLVREQDESYASLVRRAQITARAGVQRSFDADLLVTEAIVVVVGESQGITVPILTVEVTRNQWRNLPDVTYWAKYYSTANALMGL